MSGNGQWRFELLAHGIDLAFDGVTCHSALGQALGNQRANPGRLDNEQGLRSGGPRPCGTLSRISMSRFGGGCSTSESGPVQGEVGGP